MWWFVSLCSAGIAMLLLVAGVCWPWVRARPLASSVSLFQPWWLVWVQICSPLLSWRYRWYIQRVLGLTAQSPQAIDHFFAKQCAGVMLCLGFGSMGALLKQQWGYGVVGVVMAILVFLLPLLRAHQQRNQSKKHMQRDFPFMLDLVCLSIEAGHGVHQALFMCSAELPQGILKQQLLLVQESMRAGLSREQAFKAFTERVALAEAHAFVAALQQSIELGGRLAPVLKQQAQQRRQERFLRAEKQALEAPVKMLLPLVLCIFPCTFLVIAYPLFFQLWQQL